MQVKLAAAARAILKRLPAINALAAAEIALLAGLAAQTARLVWSAVTPIAPLGEWRPVAPTVPLAPGAVLRGFDPFYRLGGGAPGPAVVTSLRLTLFGTRIDEATGRGSAIIAGPDGVQQSVALGGEIMAGVVLKQVAFDHVTIDRGGTREDLFIDQSAGAAGAAGGAGGASPHDGGPPGGGLSGGGLSGGGADAPGGMTIDRFQSEVGFVPRIDGGRISGLVVRPQGSGAAFRAAGLKEGDIITAIGGRPVNGPADVTALATGLAGGGTLSLTVQRDGRAVPLSLVVAPK